MKADRSQVVWVPHNGSKEMRTFIVSPSLLRIFSLIVLLCVCSVPLLETGLLGLSKRVADLEQKKQQLHAEILTLQYVRKSLGRIEAKEERLRNYFGMEKYKSLEQMMGVGGESTLELYGKNFAPEGFQSSSEVPSFVPERNIADENMPKKLRTLVSNFEILNKLRVEQGEAWENTPSILPVTIKKPGTRISSTFGWRENPFTNRREFHSGIDIIGPKKTMIIAPARGVAIAKGYDRWLGHYLVLRHTGEIKTIYGHLEEISVNEGTEVKRGDLLGFMGNTGLSTNRHLHYQVVVNDRAVDPMQYILDRMGE